MLMCPPESCSTHRNRCSQGDNTGEGSKASAKLLLTVRFSGVLRHDFEYLGTIFKMHGAAGQVVVTSYEMLQRLTCDACRTGPPTQTTPTCPGKQVSIASSVAHGLPRKSPLPVEDTR